MSTTFHFLSAGFLDVASLLVVSVVNREWRHQALGLFTTSAAVEFDVECIGATELLVWAHENRFKRTVLGRAKYNNFVAWTKRFPGSITCLRLRVGEDEGRCDLMTFRHCHAQVQQVEMYMNEWPAIFMCRLPKLTTLCCLFTDENQECMMYPKDFEMRLAAFQAASPNLRTIRLHTRPITGLGMSSAFTSFIYPLLTDLHFDGVLGGNSAKSEPNLCWLTRLTTLHCDNIIKDHTIPQESLNIITDLSMEVNLLTARLYLPGLERLQLDSMLPPQHTLDCPILRELTVDVRGHMKDWVTWHTLSKSMPNLEKLTFIVQAGLDFLKWGSCHDAVVSGISTIVLDCRESTTTNDHDDVVLRNYMAKTYPSIAFVLKGDNRVPL